MVKMANFMWYIYNLPYFKMERNEYEFITVDIYNKTDKRGICT